MGRIYVQRLNQIGQEEGNKNLRREKCRENEKADAFLVNIHQFQSNNTRMNSNFGMRFTTSSSIARDLHVYKICK